MKIHTKLTLVAILAAVILASYFFLVRPGGDSPSQPATQSVSEVSRPIRVAFDTWFGYSSFFLARDLGLYKKRGLDVEVAIINPLQEKNAAMARGDLDVMGGSFDSAVISSHAGVPGAIVYVFEESLGNDALVVKKGITKAEDLRGKRIAVDVGYVSHLFILNYLDLSGLKLDETEIVPLSPDGGVAAFLSGAVDAVALYEPFLSRALGKPDSHTLVTSRSMDPLFCGTAYASKRMIDRHPESLQLFVQALQEANDFWRQNPDKGNDLVAKFWKLPIDEVEAVVVNTKLFTVDDQKRFFGTENTPGLLHGYVKRVADLWSQVDVVPEDYPTEGLVNPRFVRELY